MFSRLYTRVKSYAEHPAALWALIIVSFTESSIFLVPPDVLLAPMVVGAPAHALRYALVCTMASVAGGVAGYAIGSLLYASVGVWVIETYGLQAGYEEFSALYAEYGALVVLIGALTPLPYKAVTIASGVVGIDILTFIVASFFGRGFRFFVLAIALKIIGPRVEPLLEKYFGPIMALVLIGVVLGLVFVKGLGQ